MGPKQQQSFKGMQKQEVSSDINISASPMQMGAIPLFLLSDSLLWMVQCVTGICDLWAE